MKCKIIEFLEKELEERKSWLRASPYNHNRTNDDVAREERLTDECEIIEVLLETRKKELKEETLEKVKQKLTKEEIKILGLNLKEDQNEKM